ERHGEGRPPRLGCPYAPLLLEISAAGSRAVGRLPTGGDGAAGCRGERQHWVDGEVSSTPSGVGERALRRRRSCAPRGADSPAARARRGPERWGNALSCSGYSRQRRPKGPGGERKAQRGESRDDPAP